MNAQGLLYTGMQELQIDQAIIIDVVMIAEGSPDFLNKCCVGFWCFEEEKEDGVQGDLDRVVSGNEELERYLLQVDLLLRGARGRGIGGEHVVHEIGMLRISPVADAFLDLLAVDPEHLGQRPEDLGGDEEYGKDT